MVDRPDLGPLTFLLIDDRGNSDPPALAARQIIKNNLKSSYTNLWIENYISPQVKLINPFQCNHKKLFFFQNESVRNWRNWGQLWWWFCPSTNTVSYAKCVQKYVNDEYKKYGISNPLKYLDCTRYIQMKRIK